MKLVLVDVRGIAALIALLVVSRAQVVAQSAFEQAVGAYQSGDYATAREGWLRALSEPGGDRAAALYDLGNVAFRERKPLEAAGWYTASVRVDPRFEDAWHNLEFARREAGLEPADRGDLRATAKRLASSLTAAESERVVLVACAGLALALAWEALRGGRAARWTCAAAAGVVLLALVPWTYQRSRAGRDDVFVIQPEGATLYSEPRTEAAVIGRVAPASEPERVDALPGWLRVRTADGEVGWISSASAITVAA